MRALNAGKKRILSALMAVSMLINTAATPVGSYAPPSEISSEGIKELKKMNPDDVVVRVSENGADEYRAVFGDITAKISDEKEQKTLSFLDNTVPYEDDIYREFGMYVDTILPVVIGDEDKIPEISVEEGISDEDSDKYLSEVEQIIVEDEEAKKEASVSDDKLSGTKEYEIEVSEDDKSEKDDEKTEKTETVKNTKTEEKTENETTAENAEIKNVEVSVEEEGLKADDVLDEAEGVEEKESETDDADTANEAEKNSNAENNDEENDAESISSDENIVTKEPEADETETANAEGQEEKIKWEDLINAKKNAKNNDDESDDESEVHTVRLYAHNISDVSSCLLFQYTEDGWEETEFYMGDDVIEHTHPIKKATPSDMEDDEPEYEEHLEFVEFEAYYNAAIMFVEPIEEGEFTEYVVYDEELETPDSDDELLKPNELTKQTLAILSGHEDSILPFTGEILKQNKKSEETDDEFYDSEDGDELPSDDEPSLDITRVGGTELIEQDPVTGDNTTIERITVRWLTASTGETEPAKFDRLNIVADRDNISNMQFQIDFTLTGRQDHAPGAIELVFPAYIFKTRNGTEMGELTLSVPTEEEGGDSEFVWKRVGDNIVITNTRTVIAASKAMIQGTWRNSYYEDTITYAHEMVDIDTVDGNEPYPGISDKFYAQLNLETPNGQVLHMKSNEVDATIDTEVEIATAEMTALNVNTGTPYVYFDRSKAMTAGLPSSFLPANPDDYVYVRWYVSGTAIGGQPFTMTLNDTAENNYGCVMLGADRNGQTVKSSNGQSVSIDMFNGFSESAKSAYIWTAYPKSSFTDEQETYTLRNSATVSVTGIDDEITTTRTANASVNIKVPLTYTIKKIWDDNDNAKGKRPGTVTFYIYRCDRENSNGTSGYSLWKSVTTDAAHSWQYQFSDDGIPYLYKVDEGNLPGGIIKDYYDENGTRHTLRWSYYKESSDWNVDTRTWTFTNAYTEGWGITEFSNLNKTSSWTYEDPALKSSRDSMLNRLERGNDITVPYYVDNYASFIYHTQDPNSTRSLTAEFIDEEIRLKKYGAQNFSPYTKNDLDIASINLNSVTAYNYSSPITVGEAGSQETYYERHVVPNHNPLYIYGFDGTNWVKFGTYQNDTLTAESGSGASASGKTLIFPLGITKTKMLHEGIEAAFDVYYTVNVRIHPTESMLALLREMYAESDYAMFQVYNEAKLNIYENDDQLIALRDYANSYVHGRKYRVAARQTKQFRLVSNDIPRRTLKLHVKSEVYQQSNVLQNYRSDYDYFTSENLIPDVKSGVFYDLLPMGIIPDLESVKLQSGDAIKNVNKIENYKGTGRVLLIVEADFARHVGYASSRQYPDDAYPQEGYYNKQLIEFDCYYPWDEAYSYGLVGIKNICAFETDDEWIGNVTGWSGEADDASGTNNKTTIPALGEERTLFENLDANRDDNSFIYAGAYLNTEEVDFAALTSLRKHVRTGSQEWRSGYANDVNVVEGGIYSYRLMVQSATDTSSTDIILVDSLENFPRSERPADDDNYTIQWRGKLQSIDLSNIIAKDIDYKIYYSTTPNIDVSGLNPTEEEGVCIANIQASPDWSDTPPADLGDVTGLAFDLRYKTNGEQFVLEENESLMIYIHMKAPEGAAAAPYMSAVEPENHLMNAHAYNDIYIDHSNRVQGNSNIRDYYKAIETKVGIYAYTINVTKEWDDYNDNDGIRPDSVTVHLLQNDVDTGMSAVLNDGNDWSAKFKVPQFDSNDMAYIYTFNEEPVAGYTLSQQKNGQNYILKNTHEPETIDIPVQKVWIDDELEDGTFARPNSINVRLYADDKPTGKNRTIRGPEWTTTYTGLFKYRDGGIPIVYDIREDAVPDFITTYDTDGNTKVVNNRYYPFGDLLVTKTLSNETTQTEDDEFDFEISFKDKNGNTLTDRYTYVYTLADSTEETGFISSGGTFTLHGGETFRVVDLPSKTVYSVSEQKRDGFTIRSQGANGTIISGQTKTAAFTNEYKTAGSAEIRATKNLTARELKRYQFKFSLYSYDENTGTKTLIKKAANAADGSVAFSTLKYKNEDNGKTFWYVIEEDNGGKPGYTYDTTSYLVKVIPVDNGDGTMSTEIHYYKAESAQWFDGLGNIQLAESDNALFTNAYHASGSTALKAWKLLEPSSYDLPANEFTFTLKDETGNTIGTAKNKADGTVEFSVINYTEADIGKTFHYYIMEDVPAVSATDPYIYDTHTHSYEVTVIDNGDGTLFLSKAFGEVGEATCDACNGTGMQKWSSWLMDAFPDEEDVPVYVRIPWTEMEVGESYLLVAPNWYVHQQYPESGGWYRILTDRLSQSFSYVPRNALNIRSDAKGNLLGGTIAQTAETHDSSGYLPIVIGGQTYEDYMVVPPQDYMNYQYQSVNDDMWALHQYAELTLEESNEQLDTCDFTGCFALKQKDGTYLAIDSATPWAGTQPTYKFASSSGYDSSRNAWINKSLTLGNGTYNQDNLKISSYAPWGDQSFRTVAYPDFYFYGSEPGTTASLYGNTSAEGADFMVFKFIEHPGDMCDVCGGTGRKFAYTDGGEGKIPVFTNRLKDGTLTISKHIDPSSAAGYDPDQKFRFKVVLNGADASSLNITYSTTVQKKPLVDVVYDANDGHFGDGVTNINEVQYRLMADRNTYEIVSGEVLTPVRDGYTFDGWYADEELTQPFTEANISDDAAAFAKWTLLDDTCPDCYGQGYYWNDGEGDRTVWVGISSDGQNYTVGGQTARTLPLGASATVGHLNGANQVWHSTSELRDEYGADYEFDNMISYTSGSEAYVTGSVALVAPNGKFAWTDTAAQLGTVKFSENGDPFITVNNITATDDVLGKPMYANTFKFKSIPADDPGYSEYGPDSVSLFPQGIGLSHFTQPGTSSIEELSESQKLRLIGTFTGNGSHDKDIVNYATDTSYNSTNNFQRCDQFYIHTHGGYVYSYQYGRSTHAYYLVNSELMLTSVTDAANVSASNYTEDELNLTYDSADGTKFKIFRPVTFHTCEHCNGTGHVTP